MRWLSCAVVLVLALAVPTVALADGTCEILLIRASHGAGGIEPRLRAIKQLGRPPLSLWREMRLVQKKEVALSGGAVAEVTFSNQWKIRLREAGRSPEGFRYEAVVQRPGGPDRIRFTATPGAPFFTVIQRGREAYILGFTCR